MRIVEVSIDLPLPPKEVLEAFISHRHLRAWWGVDKSLIELAKGGLYTLVWRNHGDGIGYVTTGTVAEYLPACQLKIENLVYINPERPVLGPIEMLVLTTPLDDHQTQLTIIQAGFQQGADWDWLYEAVRNAWPEVLGKIKNYLLSTV